jgi:pyridoxamine 5'-phosphate oxidase-like protein
MSAAEFVEFWQSVRLVAMATVGEGGRPHIAPVHATLNGCILRLVIYYNTIRRADLTRNPRVAFSTWRADGARPRSFMVALARPLGCARFCGGQYTRYVGGVEMRGRSKKKQSLVPAPMPQTSGHSLTAKFHSAGSDSKNDQE